MSTVSEKTTFTLGEAASLLSCHRDTLRAAILGGELRAAKIGKSYRISRSDLESFWTDKGGKDLFGKREVEENKPAPAVSAGKKGTKKPMQEQFSLLGAFPSEGASPDALDDE